MRKINDTMNRLAVAAYVKGGRMRKKLADVLTRKEGEGFVDTALKILISVVVGALLLADAFLVTGVRVVECEKGITVFMPSMKDKEDEYRDVCFPIKPELRSQINTAVLNAYDASLKENEMDGE